MESSCLIGLRSLYSSITSSVGSLADRKDRAPVSINNICQTRELSQKNIACFFPKTLI